MAPEAPARTLVAGPSPALSSSIPASVAFGLTALPLSRAIDINDRETVVGDIGGNNIAAYWTPTGGMVVLGQVHTGSTACCSSLVDLNASNHALGHSTYGGGILLTSFTLTTGSYTDLPTGRGRNFSAGLNDRGEAVATDDASGGRPFHRSPSGAVTPLSFAPSFFSGWSTDINNAGVITGYLFLSGVGHHAVAWPHHTSAPIDLGSLGGQSYALGLSEAGDIVGFSYPSGSTVHHATLWPASGGIVDLHTWPNACPGHSLANDVNDNGVIVGYCNSRPVIWTAVEGMRYLPISASSGEARAINNRNVVVGMSPLGFGGAIWRPLNSPPIADAGPGYLGDEGNPVTFDGTASRDPDGDALRYDWDFGDGATGSGPTPTHVYADDGNYTVTLVVTDVHGASSDRASTTATIANVAPDLEALVGPTDPIALVNGSASATISGGFSDPGTLDIHSGTLTCDGGTAGPVAIDERSATASGDCTFTTTGVYLVTLTLSDDDHAGDRERLAQYVVVYDPSGGFVTGGGWIDSPAGAYTVDPTVVGKATFGFVSKYHHGAQVPSGNTEFQFHAGSFNFSSTAYQWLVIAGPKAQYKGDGTVNGVSGYRFLLTAVDGQASGGGGTDRFRIKVWEQATGRVVYDNVLGASDDIDHASPQALGGGSIGIKK